MILGPVVIVLIIVVFVAILAATGRNRLGCLGRRIATSAGWSRRRPWVSPSDTAGSSGVSGSCRRARRGPRRRPVVT
jgi:hypothetical protein